MSSVIIVKGMKMPKSCDECFVYKSICPATTKRIKALGDDVVPKNHRHSDCPLVEIATSHGMLSADAEEVERGRWIKTVGENGVTSACRCSNCGFGDNRYSLFKYCPVCGARMDGGT